MFWDQQPLPPAEEKELKETLQEIIGEGKKVTVEQKVYIYVMFVIIIKPEC